MELYCWWCLFEGQGGKKVSMSTVRAGRGMIKSSLGAGGKGYAHAQKPRT